MMKHYISEHKDIVTHEQFNKYFRSILDAFDDDDDAAKEIHARKVENLTPITEDATV